MMVTPSQFYIPENRPLVMIANGSGIAPFRSLTQYYANLPADKRPFLRLYSFAYTATTASRTRSLITTLSKTGISGRVRMC